MAVFSADSPTSTNADFFHIPWDEINCFPNGGPSSDSPPGGSTGSLPGSQPQTTTTQAQRSSQHSSSTSWGWAAGDAQPSWYSRSTSNQSYWYTRSTNNHPPRHNVYALSKQSFTPFKRILQSMNINMFTIF